MTSNPRGGAPQFNVVIHSGKDNTILAAVEGAKIARTAGIPTSTISANRWRLTGPAHAATMVTSLEGGKRREQARVSMSTQRTGAISIISLVLIELPLGSYSCWRGPEH